MKVLSILALLSAMHSTGHSESVRVQYGIAKHYTPGLMLRVMHNRGMEWPSGVTGLASRVNCSTIGQIFSARINGHYERLLQVDCSQYRDAPRHRKEGLIVEVDYSTAVRDGIARRGMGPAVVWR